MENREEEESAEEEEELGMDVDSEDDNETIMYSMIDDGTRTSTSKNPLPTALTPIGKIAKKLFKGEWAYTRLIPEGGRVEIFTIKQPDYMNEIAHVFKGSDILTCSETWLSNAIPNHMVAIPAVT